jgi:hypothetical protein
MNESPSGDPAQRLPCPNCGSTARAFSVQAEVAATASATATVEIITYPQNLLGVARRLIEDGQFSIAVIVAHMACEIAVERSLSESFSRKGIQYLEEPACDLLNGYNLANDRIRKLYSALTGDEIQTQPFWGRFKESATRRNLIIHQGVIVGKAEAEESFKAATDLVANLGK